jgi:hypothetical protein
MLGPEARSIHQRRATSPRSHDHSGAHPCPKRPCRRGMGLPLSRRGQPPRATATRTTTPNQPGHALEGPGPAVSTRSTSHRPRHTCPRGHGGHGPCAGRIHVGDCHAGPRYTLRPRELTTPRRTQQDGPPASDETPPRCGVPLGRVKRRVEDTRTSTAVGTRRRHVRGSPTHGSPQDEPSDLPGSASSDAPRTKAS